MAMRAFLASALWAMAACGGPVLQNAPRPDPAVVAGAAAATAAAITLAAPDAAARNAEDARRQAHIERDGDGGARETAPAEVLDRLDAAVAGAPPAAPAGPSRRSERFSIPLLAPAARR